MVRLLIIFLMLALQSVAYASVCTIFVHGYTRTSEGYFGNLDHQVPWDSSKPIPEAAPVVANGILKEMSTCEKDAPVILRTHSYGTAQVFYILAQGKRFQDLYPDHPFVKVYKQTVAFYAYTGAFHGTPIMDVLCSSKIISDMGDWAKKPCVSGLLSSPQIDVSNYVTNSGVPTYIIYSTYDSAWLGAPGAIIAHFGQDYPSFVNDKIRTQNDDTLPIFATLACSSPTPLIHENDNCQKIDSNFIFDVYHETKLGHLDFRRNSIYMTKKQSEFLNNPSVSNTIKNIEIYKKQQNYDSNLTPIDSTRMGNPVLRHEDYIGQWLSLSKETNFSARITSDKVYFSNEIQGHFLLEYSEKKLPLFSRAKIDLKSKDQILTQIQVKYSRKKQGPFIVNLSELPDGDYTLQTILDEEAVLTPVTRTFVINRTLPALSKKISDQLTNSKDLLISTNWNAKKEGKYLIETVLRDSNDTPIVALETIAQMKPGEQNIELIWDGFYFSDKKLSGPFHIKEMAVSEILPASFELKRGPLIKLNYTTGDYNWDKFKNIPTPDPVMSDKVKMLLKNPDAIE